MTEVYLLLLSVHSQFHSTQISRAWTDGRTEVKLITSSTFWLTFPLFPEVCIECYWIVLSFQQSEVIENVPSGRPRKHATHSRRGRRKSIQPLNTSVTACTWSNSVCTVREHKTVWHNWAAFIDEEIATCLIKSGVIINEPMSCSTRDSFFPQHNWGGKCAYPFEAARCVCVFSMLYVHALHARMLPTSQPYIYVSRYSHI